jgi:hypothetical protein
MNISPFFVIARYKENIDWLSLRDYFSDGVIYNKGPDDISYKGKIVKLSNYPDWGRESETYTRFIVENYGDLPDYIVFTQADPFEHSPNFIEVIDILSTQNRWKNYQPLTSGCFGGKTQINGNVRCGATIYFDDLGFPIHTDQVPPLESILYDKTEYVDNYPIFFETIDSSMDAFYFKDEVIYKTLESYRKQQNIFLAANTLARTYKRLGLSKPFCGYAKFNYGAIFGIKKSNILKHTKSFYEKLHEFTIENPSHGYIMERMWYTILN